MTAIAPASGTAPRPWTAAARTRRTHPPHPVGPARPPRGRSSDHSPDGGAAREPSDIGPHNSESTAAWRHDQPRRGDPTNSPGREPSDTDPHEIPSSAVSAAPSAPRPRRQQPGGRPCTRTPMAPIESSQKQAKGGQKRPRSAGAARYDSRLRLPRFSESRFTDHGSRSFPIGGLGSLATRAVWGREGPQSCAGGGDTRPGDTTAVEPTTARSGEACPSPCQGSRDKRFDTWGSA